MCAKPCVLSVVLLLPLVSVVSSCRQYQPVQSQQRQRDRSQERVLQVADKAAEEELARFNETEHGKKLAEKFGGPFLLKDYTRQVDAKKESADGRAGWMVHYQTTRPAPLGHPQHFGVWIYADTGETRLFGGR